MIAANKVNPMKEPCLAQAKIRHSTDIVPLKLAAVLGNYDKTFPDQNPGIVLIERVNGKIIFGINHNPVSVPVFVQCGVINVFFYTIRLRHIR